MVPRLGASLPIRGNRAGLKIITHLKKKKDDGQSPPKKKIVLVNFSFVLFFHLDFLTLVEDGTDMFSQNVAKELPLSAA